MYNQAQDCYIKPYYMYNQAQDCYIKPYYMYNQAQDCLEYLVLPSAFDIPRDSNLIWPLTFKRRIKSRLPFAGIIRSSPYSTRFQDKG